MAGRAVEMIVASTAEDTSDQEGCEDQPETTASVLRLFVIGGIPPIWHRFFGGCICFFPPQNSGLCQGKTLGRAREVDFQKQIFETATIH